MPLRFRRRGLMRMGLAVAAALSGSALILGSCGVRPAHAPGRVPDPTAGTAPPLVGVWLGPERSAWRFRADGTFAAALPSGRLLSGSWGTEGHDLRLGSGGSGFTFALVQWRVSEDEKTLVLAPAPFATSPISYRRAALDIYPTFHRGGPPKER